MKRFLALLAAVALPVVGLSAAAQADVATGTLHIENNGSYSRDYSNVQYSCGTDNEVLFTATEQAGLTGSNDDGLRYSTITGTINTSTGVLNWNYQRESYTASFSGTGTWTAGTYTFTQNDPDPAATGGVNDASGTFTNVPSCASTPAKPADVCKNGGWQTNPNGPFRNQGDCVSDYARGIY